MCSTKIKTAIIAVFFLSLNIGCTRYFQDHPCKTQPVPCQPNKMSVTPIKQDLKIKSTSFIPPASEKKPPVSGELPAKQTRSTASFDYYLLSFSWSPAFCRTHQGKSTQCQHLPRYRFVLHGLWPNKIHDANPESCSSQRIDDTIIQDMLSIMPDKNLIQHEWQKHGTCSGLTPEKYFNLAKQAYNTIQFPDFFYSNQPIVKRNDEIKQALVQKNPTLRYDSIKTLNYKKQLTEIRICLDKHLHSIQCPATDEMVALTIIPPRQ